MPERNRRQAPPKSDRTVNTWFVVFCFFFSGFFFGFAATIYMTIFLLVVLGIIKLAEIFEYIK